MADGYTIFVTYILLSENGQSKSIHCNYIKSLLLEAGNPYLQEVSIAFNDINDFKFLNEDINNNTGGYTVHWIHGLVQVVNNSGFTTYADVKPDPAQWREYDLTPQIHGHGQGSYPTPPEPFYGNALTAIELTQQTFKIPLYPTDNRPTYSTTFPNGYNDYPIYVLHDYIDYPNVNATDELAFGDEQFFLGNVSTEIKAIAYTTNISVVLPLNEFNSSTNETWDGEDVIITEVGIYDENNNLVAIGKLNNPINKNSSISRTIVFAVDF